MIKEKLQSYLTNVYPDAYIETEHTIRGNVYIRFELGGELRNGTKKRVNQAVERAFAIFEEAFPDLEEEIFVLVYDYFGSMFNNRISNYLYDQFPKDAFGKFYNHLESVNTPFFSLDDDGNVIFEKADVKVVIGKLPIKWINVRNILNGIANSEMGFEPFVDQRIYFLNPKTNIMFHMYDDRGCLVWSDVPDKIRSLYNKRTDWIVECDRPEIDEYFI